MRHFTPKKLSKNHIQNALDVVFSSKTFTVQISISCAQKIHDHKFNIKYFKC